MPKERAAIQLPETKRPFPKRRAAWGWLPAAAFHPANPQPEASAGFLVPFSKKGTSLVRRHNSPPQPVIPFPVLHPPYHTHPALSPSTHSSVLSPPKHQSALPQPQPSAGPLCREPLPPTKPSAHKRPVDRPVGLRVCRCRYRRRPLADLPKERAAIQLPGTKRPFPKRRAAWGWLPAAAFHPANPQPEASAGFLVPFSKKGTSFMRRHSSPTQPATLFPILRPHAARLMCRAPHSQPEIPFPRPSSPRRPPDAPHTSPPQPAILSPVLRPRNTPSPHHTVPSCPTSSRCLCAETSLPLSVAPFVQHFELPSKVC